ncbi:hypothetical protein SAMN06265365_108173 [Tistlia consotensis]|uniref:DUF4376 domain-containing protein n=1 Tax=Tistlia consotensis USBA 355 TaxID=560819 RepID=A0A1Y6BQT6_9PROT|nr:hypothetical protein [Tistlia consotensis]SMF23411.1 hypothetical protein SAMN05428998_1087 [Tistlia consotensis USBA 355]SNR61690.1 hypothetical protein SAMN06265365_108173 [Tistlia consotensis]
MPTYAEILPGQPIREVVFGRALQPDEIKHIGGLPTLRPLVVDLSVPSGYRGIGTDYQVADVQVTKVAVTEAIPLAEQADAKAATARRIGAAKMDAIVIDYSEQERLTFAKQLSEAQAYDPNATAQENEASCPMLVQLAAARPDIATLADMVDLVLAKDTAWSLAVGAVLGVQQGFEKACEAAKAAADQAAVDAIDVTTGWPGEA